jgi:hypothetical protein
MVIYLSSPLFLVPSPLASGPYVSSLTLSPNTSFINGQETDARNIADEGINPGSSRTLGRQGLWSDHIPFS